MGDSEDWDSSETNVTGKARRMTITITKAGVLAWLFAAIIVVLLVVVRFQEVQSYLQDDHIASLKKANSEITTENSDLKSENASLKAKIGSAPGSAPMGAAHGGIWDTVVEGKNAVAIITSLLLVDKAATSQERHEKLTAALASIADKTDSKLIDLIAAHVANPSPATLQPVIDFLLKK